MPSSRSFFPHRPSRGVPPTENWPDISQWLSQLRALLPGVSLSWAACIPLTAAIVVVWGLSAQAQAPGAPEPSPQFILNNIFVFISAILVIFMNAGFAMVETGLCRQKNAVNVLSKNLIVFALSVVAYWVIGFSLMYGTDVASGWFHFNGLFFDPAISDEVIKDEKLVPTVNFLFQVAFAGTAATIVSGAVAERIRFLDFIIFSLLLVGIIYPIAGGWTWNGGWLSKLGFVDFAGSTLVHSVGGWAALLGAAMLGPRIGKYREGGMSPIPGHNLSLATLGCLILWIGWYGFNPGSQLAADTMVPYIAVTTTLGGAAGGCTATITSWVTGGKPDLSMIINGILAGLVGITAGCADYSLGGSFIVGAIAGVIVVFSVYTFDNLKIDDPVGALSVHLMNGIWGTLAVGLFSAGLRDGGAKTGLLLGGGFEQLGHQIVGILAYGIWTLVTCWIAWAIIRAIFGLRVSEEDEMKGLDISEHGMEAYPGFVKDDTFLSR
jgi:ammonium transporter, Amt family